MLQGNYSKQRGIAVSAGVSAGVAVEVFAVIAAIVSGGAGHGSYVAARLLFPFSSLLMLVEGEFGPFGIGIGLLQYPVYGGLIGLTLASHRFRVLVAFLALHLIAALACFSGILCDFV